jgi:hypothetical protein
LLQVQASLVGATVRAAEAPLARARHLLEMLPGGAPWGDLHRLGGLARGLDGDLEGAGVLLEEALSTALAAGDRRQEALARRVLARGAWHRGDAGRAAREAALAVAWQGRMGAFLELVRSLRLLHELGGKVVRLSAGDGTMQRDPLDRLRRAGAVAEAEHLATREGVLAWQP